MIREGPNQVAVQKMDTKGTIKIKDLEVCANIVLVEFVCN